MSNINDIEDNFWTQFWNESTNGSNLNLEQGDNIDDDDLEEKYPKIDKKNSSKILK